MTELISFGVDLEGYEVFSKSEDIKIYNVDFQNIRDWCIKNNIDAKLIMAAAGFTLWRVKDVSKRSWFTLRWANDIQVE